MDWHGIQRGSKIKKHSHYRQFSARMSPVEFSNYIKQRTTLQQPPPYIQSPNAMMGHNLKPLMSPSRSISPANHTAPALSINSDPFYYHNNGYYGQQQQQPQSYLGSHHQLSYGAASGGGGGLPNASMAASSPSGNAISSSISSISSTSSSSASSSVSSSSLGEQLLFGGQFASNTNNRLSGQMYNFYGGNEAPFGDNGFFAPISAASSTLASQFEDSELLIEGNPTKFGVIGGGLSGQGATVMQQEQKVGDTGAPSNSTNNNNAAESPNSNSMENLQSNSFYNGSSSSPFPQLLVAN